MNSRQEGPPYKTEKSLKAELTVKVAKEEACKEFGEKLESDYGSAMKRFWQAILRLKEKRAGGVWAEIQRTIF